MKPTREWTREEQTDELERVQVYGALSLPRKVEFPKLPGIDYFATVEPYKGCVGGDYLAIINFDYYQIRQKIRQAKKDGNDALAATLAKNLDRFGIAIGDVAGHGIAESFIVGELDGAFRAFVDGQIETYGEVTAELGEKLNHLVHRLIKPDFVKRKPYITFSYGEVDNDGVYRYFLAGHPAPIIFSAEYGRMQEIDKERKKASTPLGIFPSKYHVDAQDFIHVVGRSDVNEVHLLMPNDALILYSDALLEQRSGELNFAETHLEGVLRETIGEPARTIHDAIKRELFAFCPPDDDLTIAVIKKK